MSDIVSIFPTAEELRADGVERFSLYLFEEELKSTLRLIIWGKSQGFDKIQINDPSAQVLEFLIEKGYSIIDGDNLNGTWIKWGD